MKKSSDSAELMNLVLTLAAIFSMVLTTLKIIEWTNRRNSANKSGDSDDKI